MTRSDITREVRSLAYGLLKGMGGATYTSPEISKMLKERFGVDVDPGTLRNWKGAMDEEMKKWGVTDQDIQDAIIKGLSGKLPEGGPPKVPEPVIAPPVAPQGVEAHKMAYSNAGEGTPGAKSGTPLTVVPQESLNFANIADVIAFAESKGFYVGKSLADIIAYMEEKGLQVVDKKQIMFGIQDLYVQPIELDIEVIGRSIAANPVIQFYYALMRMYQPEAQLDEFLTGCVIDSMNARQIGILIYKGMKLK